jgi:hypothetical protein
VMTINDDHDIMIVITTNNGIYHGI